MSWKSISVHPRGVLFFLSPSDSRKLLFLNGLFKCYLIMYHRCYILYTKSIYQLFVPSKTKKRTSPVQCGVSAIQSAFLALHPTSPSRSVLSLYDLGSGQVHRHTGWSERHLRQNGLLGGGWGYSFSPHSACWPLHSQPAKGVNIFLTKSCIVQPRLWVRAGSNPRFPV